MIETSTPVPAPDSDLTAHLDELAEALRGEQLRTFRRLILRAAARCGHLCCQAATRLQVELARDAVAQTQRHLHRYHRAVAEHEDAAIVARHLVEAGRCDRHLRRLQGICTHCIRRDQADDEQRRALTVDTACLAAGILALVGGYRPLTGPDALQLQIATEATRTGHLWSAGRALVRLAEPGPRARR